MRRRRASSVTWLSRALPHWDALQTVEPGGRLAFVDRMATELGLSTNTSRRMLASINYLMERGANPEHLAADPPALNAIEAVSRIGRLDPERERSALEILLRNGAPVVHFLALAAEAQAADAKRTSADKRTRQTITLEVLLAEIAPGTPASAIRPQNPTAFGPRHLVNTRTGMLAVFIFAADHFLVATPQFQALADRAVLRGLATYDRTVVCRGVPLIDLDESCQRMQGAWRDRLIILDIILESAEASRPE